MRTPVRLIVVRRVLVSLATLVVAGFGSAQGLTLPGQNPTGPGQGPTGPGQFDDARSQTCSEVSGLRALYWDFSNGAFRADYPETYRLVPYAGALFGHPVQPLYTFAYPPGWTAVTLNDPSMQLMGANVVRADGQSVWRRLNLTMPGTVRAASIVGTELDLMASTLGLSGSYQVRCTVPSYVDPTSGFEMTAVLVDADTYTASIHAQAFHSGGLTVAFIQMSVAPASQYDEAALNVFFPLSGQLLPPRSSGQPQCSDGQDNDGDGKIDYPNDPGCTSPEDTSEEG